MNVNAETITFASVIILGLIGALAIVAGAYGEAKRDQAITSAVAPYQGIASSLLDRLEARAVTYAPQLKPVNDLATAAQTLIDEDTDTLARILPAATVAALRQALRIVEDVSDGVVEETDRVDGPTLADQAPKG